MSVDTIRHHWQHTWEPTSFSEMSKGQIHTRSGDSGQCSLLGGSRVDKDHVRIECLGEVDEVNSFIGLLRAKLPIDHSWQKGLQEIQANLMNMMSHLATPEGRESEVTTPLPTEYVEILEDWLDEIETRLPSTTDSFLLPGGSEVSALCHVVRTLVRRAERRIISLHKVEPVAPDILRFMNRLSDLFFKFAREDLSNHQIPEEKWRAFVYRG